MSVANFRIQDGLEFPDGTTQSSSGGVVTSSSILLGTKIGFDANLQSAMANPTLQYWNLAGGTFSVGEIIQSDNGSTASVLIDDMSNNMTLESGYGNFSTASSILGLSNGATADILVFTYLGKADQVITLSGGYKYLISNVVITNATSSSGSMGTADQLSIWTGPTQSGYKLYDSIGGIAQLSNSDYFIVSYAANMGMTTNIMVTSGEVYASLNVVVGATSSFDVYLYGYIF